MNGNSSVRRAMNSNIKQCFGRMIVDNVVLLDLIEYTESADCELCGTLMKKIEFKLNGEHDLLNKWAIFDMYVNTGKHYDFETQTTVETWDSLNFGDYLITEVSYNKETNITTGTAFDKMILAMVPYKKLDCAYPVDLWRYTYELANDCGLELINEPPASPIFDFTMAEQDYNGVTISADSNYIYLNGICSTYTLVGFPSIELTEGKYTVSFKHISGTMSTSGTPNLLLTHFQYININEEFGKYDIGNGMYLTPNNSEITQTFTFTAPKKVRLQIMMSGRSDTFVDTKIEYKVEPQTNQTLINQDLWENQSDITYRDIFQQIAQVMGCTAIITTTNKLYFKQITEYGLLKYDNIIKFKLETKYGPINSVVLSRTPQEDNIYMQDETSINRNGLTEWKIENNEIIDKNRDKALPTIFDNMKGINFYPMEIKTTGLGYFEIGDAFTIETNEEIDPTGPGYHPRYKQYYTVLLGYKRRITNGIEETLFCNAPSKPLTQYKYASKVMKRIKNTEIITDKQGQKIEQLVTDMYEEDGIVHENFTKVHQDIENIKISAQNSNGINLIKNSVMFDHGSNSIPSEWITDDKGTLIINTDTDSINYGAISGHSFTLNNKKISQKITVTQYNEQDPSTCYTFSTRIKKSIVGFCGVKIYNEKEQYEINIPINESCMYKEFTLNAMKPQQSYYIIEFYASEEAESTFTDNILTVGEYSKKWQQANGELMNNNAVFDKNGILLKSDQYINNQLRLNSMEVGLYDGQTKKSYLNVNGVGAPVISSQNQFNMTPLKIIPMKFKNHSGWAIVSNEGVI